MIVVLLSNGDRAKVRSPERAVLAARTMMDDAVERGVAQRFLTASFYANGKLVRSGIRRAELNAALSQ